MKKGLYLSIFAYEHEPDALRTVKFMCCRSNTMHFNLTEIMNIMPDRLNSIRMKIRLMLVTQFPYGFNIQQVSYFIVGMHE